MITPPIHILAILPAVVLAIFGIVIMVSEPFLKRSQRWIAGWLRPSLRVTSTFTMSGSSAS